VFFDNFPTTTACLEFGVIGGVDGVMKLGHVQIFCDRLCLLGDLRFPQQWRFKLWLCGL